MEDGVGDVRWLGYPMAFLSCVWHSHVASPRGLGEIWEVTCKETQDKRPRPQALFPRPGGKGRLISISNHTRD